MWLLVLSHLGNLQSVSLVGFNHKRSWQRMQRKQLPFLEPLYWRGVLGKVGGGSLQGSRTVRWTSPPTGREHPSANPKDTLWSSEMKDSGNSERGTTIPTWHLSGDMPGVSNKLAFQSKVVLICVLEFDLIALSSMELPVLLMTL